MIDDSSRLARSFIFAGALITWTLRNSLAAHNTVLRD